MIIFYAASGAALVVVLSLLVLLVLKRRMDAKVVRFLIIEGVIGGLLGIILYQALSYGQLGGMGQTDGGGGQNNGAAPTLVNPAP